MKRFEFSLNKLMGFKKQVLDTEKNTLAHLRRQQQLLEDEKTDTIAKLFSSNEEFCRRSSQGMNVMQIQVFKGYHKSLSEQIIELEKSIQKMEIKVQAQLKVVVEATKEVSSLEKLEDKQLEDYNFRVAKAEEQFIAEYVLNSSYNSDTN